MKTKNFCSAKDCVKKNEKMNYRLGENVCEPHVQQKTIVYNIWRTLNLNSEKKQLVNDRRHAKTFDWQGYADGT